MRDKFFIIDGGIGRVICSIPALEKFFLNNTDKNPLIGVSGWDSVFWGNPILQNSTYNLENKGVFNNFIKTRDIVSPEPYRVWSYYNQKKNLIQAFDEIINQTEDHSDLNIPKLYLCKEEELFASNFRTNIEKQSNNSKKKFVVFQPFGSTAKIIDDKFVDQSTRSLSASDYLKLGKKLSKHCNLILFAEKQFFLSDDDFSFKIETDYRGWFSIIANSDYFIGCDSVGQHVARSFNIKGTVILGSTFKENISYDNWFNIFEKENITKQYSPLRINGLDCMLSDRLNDCNLDLSDKDLDIIFESVMEDMNKNGK